jgi:hypothetical protein
MHTNRIAAWLLKATRERERERERWGHTNNFQHTYNMQTPLKGTDAHAHGGTRTGEHFDPRSGSSGARISAHGSTEMQTAISHAENGTSALYVHAQVFDMNTNMHTHVPPVTQDFECWLRWVYLCCMWRVLLTVHRADDERLRGADCIYHRVL